MTTLHLALSLDEAAERLRALDESDSANAFEMGDIALAAVPMTEPERDESTEGQAFDGSAGLFKDQGVTAALQELAEKAGMSWKTLQTKRRVSSRVAVRRRGNWTPWQSYRVLALTVMEPAEREILLDLVSQPNPDREDGRWTEAAIRPHLPKKPGTGSKPEMSEAEETLDQICRGIDYFVLNNDIEMLERVRSYWTRTVPDHLRNLDWWAQKKAEREALAAARAERKARKAS